jgi:hypothetical protein
VAVLSKIACVLRVSGRPAKKHPEKVSNFSILRLAYVLGFEVGRTRGSGDQAGWRNYPQSIPRCDR